MNWNTSLDDVALVAYKHNEMLNTFCSPCLSVVKLFNGQMLLGRWWDSPSFGVHFVTQEEERIVEKHEVEQYMDVEG